MLSEKTNKFKAPKSCCIPYGVLDSIYSTTMSLITDKMKQTGSIVKLHELIMEELKQQLEISEKTIREYITGIEQQFVHSKLLVIKSCSNERNLTETPLSYSILNVNAKNNDSIYKGVIDVWKHLYSQNVLEARIQYSTTWKPLMSVLIQEMIPAEYSFIAYTEGYVKIKYK